MAKRQLKKARIGVNYFESSFCGSYSCCQSAKMMQAIEDDLFTIMGLRRKESRRGKSGGGKRKDCVSFIYMHSEPEKLCCCGCEDRKSNKQRGAIQGIILLSVMSKVSLILIARETIKEGQIKRHSLSIESRVGSNGEQMRGSRANHFMHQHKNFSQKSRKGTTFESTRFKPRENSVQREGNQYGQEYRMEERRLGSLGAISDHFLMVKSFQSNKSFNIKNLSN